eukprot:INCI4845.1.p2 GENE.INCI4845.1~~INCI4845.1.p2  ORF type:complete len:207 (+),score=40.42 INCI4845.1:140-760(+)
MQPSSAHSTFLAGVAAGVAAAAGTARLVAVLRQAYYKRQRAAAKATKAAKLAARANARAAAKAKAANAKAAAGTAAAEAEQAKAACAESKGKCKRETRPPTGSEFPEYTLVDAQDLRTFAEDCLKHAGCARENAEVVADVLLSADLRGVSSHGVQRVRIDGCSMSIGRAGSEDRVLCCCLTTGASLYRHLLSCSCTSTATKFDLAL